MKNSIKKMEREIFRPYGKKILIMIAAVMLTACSNEDEAMMPEENPPLIINVSETPMTEHGASAQAVSHRGAIVNNSNFATFYMRYDEDGKKYTVTKSGSTWTADPNNSPGSGTHTFYAFSDGTFQWNGGNPYVHFGVDPSIPGQKDLLAAVNASVTGYEVNLSFKHVCSAVQFKICKTEEMANYEIVVNDAALCNVVYEGDYYFISDTWKLGSTKTSYTLNTSPFTLTTTPTNLNAASGTEYLFMIPQTLTAWDKTEISGSTTGCYLRLNCTIKKGSSDVSGYSSNAYAYLPVGGSWTKGTKYIITLKVGTALRNASGTQIITL